MMSSNLSRVLKEIKTQSSTGKEKKKMFFSNEFFLTYWLFIPNLFDKNWEVLTTCHADEYNLTVCVSNIFG